MALKYSMWESYNHLAILLSRFLVIDIKLEIYRGLCLDNYHYYYSSAF